MKIIWSVLMAICCAYSYMAQAEDAKLAPAPAEAHKVVQENKAVVIDVREKEEFEKSHLPGARSLPLSELKAGKIPEDLPKDKPIYAHCLEGIRAKEAAEILNKKGYDAQPMVATFDDLKKEFGTAK